MGRWATLITGEPRKSTFLFQQLSIVIQREMRSPSTTPLAPIRRHRRHTLLKYNVYSMRLCARGQRKITIIVIIVIIINIISLPTTKTSTLIAISHSGSLELATVVHWN